MAWPMDVVYAVGSWAGGLVHVGWRVDGGVQMYGPNQTHSEQILLAVIGEVTQLCY